MKKTLYIIFGFLSFYCLAQEGTPKKFAVYQIVIDPQAKQKLAAWQLELKYENLEIVGISGGDKPFGEPADYDSRGLTSGRIILAAFSLSKELKVGKQIVARVHGLEKAEAMSKSKIRIMAVANDAGERIDAKITMTKEVKK